MKVSPEARRLAKYKEKTKEISVATLQFDVTFWTPILCSPSIKQSFVKCTNEQMTNELYERTNDHRKEENYLPGGIIKVNVYLIVFYSQMKFGFILSQAVNSMHIKCE